MIENPFELIPDVEFVPKSVDTLLQEMTNDYETVYAELTGEQKTLESSTPERIFLYTEALRFYTAYRLIEHGCKMNLLKYSEGDYLDNLAAMVGESRLPEQRAVTTLQFTLSVVLRTAVVIPKGTRATSPGKVYFQTSDDLIIPAGETLGKCIAQACEAGAKSSGLLAGAVNTIVDPVPYVATVQNIEQSQGGADVESDEHLRLRVYMKPKSFSVAGPQDAYEYFVRAFSQVVEGVNASSPAPGEVDIRITLQGGELPTESFLTKLGAYLENKRPLTDKMSVSAPDIVEYTLKLTYYIARSKEYQLSELTTSIEDAVSEFVSWQSVNIGRDLTPDMLTSLLIRAGAKRLSIESPAFTPVKETEICKCTLVEIIFGGIEND